MDISVGDLHNDMIKLSQNGGFPNIVYYVTQKLLISDKILRWFIPTQVSKMTSKIRQICGCEICIITKDTQNNLKRSQTRPVTHL